MTHYDVDNHLIENKESKDALVAQIFSCKLKTNYRHEITIQ